MDYVAGTSAAGLCRSSQRFLAVLEALLYFGHRVHTFLPIFIFDIGGKGPLLVFEQQQHRFDGVSP